MRKTDRLLGIDRSITRRDFIGSTLIGAGSLLLSGLTPMQLRAQTPAQQIFDPWTGFGGVGDYATSNGNTPPHDSYDAMFWGERKLDVGHAFGSGDSLPVQTCGSV